MRITNEDCTEDNEVNIGVMDPQRSHLACGVFGFKVFGYFIHQLPLMDLHKEPDDVCCLTECGTDNAHL